MKTKSALLILSVLLLAGCGAESKEQGARVPGPSDAQIAFLWTGGFVGRNDRLDIRPDGAARVTTRDTSRRFQLTSAQLDELRRLVKAADLANIKAIKEPQGVADGFLYSIVYEGRTITWGDGGESPPDEVGELGSFLAGLVDSHTG